ncbi:SPRY-domain-containing protein [Obba rivulosa]|uniref:SPRY-domain-containing protein n=1 Tax=Obba rivulosa TaxID=1052685 RepID=A0A8E2DVB2_9APHY|nr:SPRY-domain-containing protein [Obba rivulosa]
MRSPRQAQPQYPSWQHTADSFAAEVQALRDSLTRSPSPSASQAYAQEDRLVPSDGGHDAFYILLPLLIVLSTFLFLLLLFLVCVILLRRRRGIMLRDTDGPVDMSREDLIEGEGGFDGVESRWLETVPDSVRRSYYRAKEYQVHSPPNSLPTDITLSQFLSIQEKGVSAWSFEPDFEALSALLVHARTELTFLPDPSSASSVQSNLPLPKLNEVYYWEVKMFDLPESTNVAVGLATKPYPPFQLPGYCRYSVAYHSNGDKSHNYPFTATPCGSSLKEGDILGVGYRPRTGTVFFTKNGRKMEDAFIGLNTWNLFPTVGADGPCSVHVNFGQSGFVFIEANVKKWGLAPSVGTLAPPPPYGSERGSILLAAGGDITTIHSGAGSPASPAGASSRSRRSHRSRRPPRTHPSGAPVESSPLRVSPLTSPSPPETPPPPITPIEEESENLAAPSSSRRYISPVDMPFHTPPHTDLPRSPPRSDAPDSTSTPDPAQAPDAWSSDSGSTSRTPSPSEGANQFNTPRPQPFTARHARGSSRTSGPELAIAVHPPPDSPSLEPPTPDVRDIHLRALSQAPTPVQDPDALGEPAREPPGYSPLDPYVYSEGVHIDLPAEVIAAALERGALPPVPLAPNPAVGSSRSERHRNRRERRT